jgi:carbohydrate diacid regulator
MTSYLIKEIYAQVKRVVGRDLAVADPHGNIYKDANDYKGLQRITTHGAISRERSSLNIEGKEKLQAVPIYYEDRPYALIVADITPEDIQTIQIITSLSELIIQQFIAQNKPRPDAVDLLLTRLVYRPDSIDSEELEQQIAALGYSLDLQRVAVIFELSGFWSNYLQTVGAPLGEKGSLIAAKKHDIEQNLISFFSKNQDNVIGYIGNDRFLVLKDLSTTDYDRFCSMLAKHYEQVTDSLKNIHIKEVTIGIGSPTSSAAGLVVSAKEALQVLEVGSKLSGKNKVHRIDALGVLPLLISSTNGQKYDYSQRILGGLDDPELTETLQAFLLANLNLTQTAESLKVHRNTVIYRLDKIAEMIGKDPRQFTDAVELYLALLFHKAFDGPK